MKSKKQVLGLLALAVIPATILAIIDTQRPELQPPDKPTYEFTDDEKTGIWTEEEWGEMNSELLFGPALDTGFYNDVPDEDIKFVCNGEFWKNLDELTREELIVIFVKNDMESLCPPYEELK